MRIHSDNGKMLIHLRESVTFAAWSSHVESTDGKHLFVVAVPPESREHLIAARSLLPAALKKECGIQSNADLDYIERHPGGALYQVNLENVGPGPGAFGEAEHAKIVARPVSHDSVQARLGNVRMPMPPLAPVYAEAGGDLAQRGLPTLRGKERDQVRQKAKQAYKPGL
jgi:hypothetical protein